MQTTALYTVTFVDNQGRTCTGGVRATSARAAKIQAKKSWDVKPGTKVEAVALLNSQR
jgi:hypothetical protein